MVLGFQKAIGRWLESWSSSAASPPGPGFRVTPPAGVPGSREELRQHAWKPRGSHSVLPATQAPTLFSGPSQARAHTLGISGSPARAAFAFRRKFPQASGAGAEGPPSPAPRPGQGLLGRARAARSTSS